MYFPSILLSLCIEQVFGFIRKKCLVEFKLISWECIVLYHKLTKKETNWYFSFTITFLINISFCYWRLVFKLMNCTRTTFEKDYVVSSLFGFFINHICKVSRPMWFVFSSVNMIYTWKNMFFSIFAFDLWVIHRENLLSKLFTLSKWWDISVRNTRIFVDVTRCKEIKVMNS